MELYIQVKDGKPFEHPLADWNMAANFPGLDPKNPPDGFARFVRNHVHESDTQIVLSTEYQLSEELTKQLGTPTYTDVHTWRDKTPEELELSKIRAETEEQNAKTLFEFQHAVQAQMHEKDGKIVVWSDVNNTTVDVNEFLEFFKKRNIDHLTFNYGTNEGLSEEDKKLLNDIIWRIKIAVEGAVGSVAMMGA